jgi:O-methyltransferase involved in polyketide biosynthesis
MYWSAVPWMRISKKVFGISDLETSLLQRHLIIDHLLEKAILESGVGQVLELACGLSPRGFRFMDRHGGNNFIYVETDLPSMARKKESMLRQARLLRDNHHVVACNILSDNGGMSLGAVASQYLNPDVPTAVITEGIINYFDRPTLEPVWVRIAELLRRLAGGVYLSSNMPNLRGHRFHPMVRLWNQIVAVVAKGKMHMHFYSDRDAEDAFKSFAFNDVRVHSPESYFTKLQIPRSRLPGFLRIIEARV